MYARGYIVCDCGMDGCCDLQVISCEVANRFYCTTGPMGKSAGRIHSIVYVFVLIGYIYQSVFVFLYSHNLFHALVYKNVAKTANEEIIINRLN